MTLLTHNRTVLLSLRLLGSIICLVALVVFLNLVTTLRRSIFR